MRINKLLNLVFTVMYRNLNVYYCNKRFLFELFFLPLFSLFLIFLLKILRVAPINIKENIVVIILFCDFGLGLLIPFANERSKIKNLQDIININPFYFLVVDVVTRLVIPILSFFVWILVIFILKREITLFNLVEDNFNFLIFYIAGWMIGIILKYILKKYRFYK
jgi:uncharacterized membrane protein YbjE (DUF340 family)